MMEEIRYKRTPNAVFRQVAGENLLVPIRGSVADMQQLYALDEVASWIWEQLQQECSAAELAEAIASEFDVTAERALTDLLPLLKSLQGQGLVAVV
jgi:hypothetical protein